jgi:hypothetical protein
MQVRERRGGPALIEQTVGNVFKTRIYPLPPNGERTVRVKTFGSFSRSAHCEFPFNFGSRAISTLHFNLRVSNIQRKRTRTLARTLRG